jgi:hypothetical protein
MGFVCSSVVEVVGFVAENIYELIFPLRGMVVVDGSTHRGRPRRSEEYVNRNFFDYSQLISLPI